MKHLTENELQDYAELPDGGEARERVEQHLAECSTCSQGVRDYRLLARLFGDPQTWRTAGNPDRAADASDLSRLEDLLAREDREADVLLAPYLGSRYRLGYGDIVTKKRYRTAGVVRRLCAAARAQVVEDAEFAAALAETAALLAEQLPASTYPVKAIQRWVGEAWKEYSTACRYMGNAPAGLEALDRAREAYERAGSGHELGVVDAARAVLLFESERYVEALEYANRAKETFVGYGQDQRVLQACQIEAGILQKMGDTVAARAALHRLLAAAEDVEDLELRAITLQNLGVSYTETDADQASKYFMLALQLYSQLGLRSELVRVRWGLAVLALTVGQHSEAEKQLRDVVKEFEAGSMRADATKARLHQAEALVQLERWDELEKVCAAVFSYYRESKLLTGALSAAAFLKEAAQRRTLTRRQVQSVQRYLKEVETKPALLFDAPPAE